MIMRFEQEVNAIVSVHNCIPSRKKKKFFFFSFFFLGENYDLCERTQSI